MNLRMFYNLLFVFNNIYFKTFTTIIELNVP